MYYSIAWAQLPGVYNTELNGLIIQPETRTGWIYRSITNYNNTHKLKH